MSDPLLVTLRLDPHAAGELEALRRRHFPAGRTQVGAHVMLFHALADTPVVAADVAEVARVTESFDVAVDGLRSLGRGVALTLSAPALMVVHRELADRWSGGLTGQDRQPYAPHVTVQNKVDPATARATLAGLAASFVPWQARAVGLEVWVYRGGPWEPRSYAAFA